MSTVPTRNPKAIFVAAVLSFFVLVVASFVVTEIATHLSNTALGKIEYMAQINKNNPMIYGTAYIKNLQPYVEVQDVLITTPIVMLIAGLFFGWKTKRANVAGIEKGAAWTGLIFSVFILAMDVFGVLEIAYLQTGQSAWNRIPPLNPGSTAVLIGEIALWTGTYTLGAWLLSKDKKQQIGSLAVRI